MAFVLAAVELALGVLAAVSQPWWLATGWMVIAALYLASGVAMVKWGSPEPRSKYPTRWRPFWPPDER